jgi:hypothetical protein
MSLTSSSKQRDPLLDLWRGLALLDMAWVHLATYPIGMAAVLAAWIGDYTRFAAGAFVLISGLTVARVFGPKLAGEPSRAAAVRRLLRRALMLACLDRIVAVAFALVERSLSVPPTVTPGHSDIVGLLRFADPGATGGLLFLYAFLLAATPVLDAALRRFGSGAVLITSAGIYALAHGGAFGSHDASWPFPVAYWQTLFVAGYVLSPRLAGLHSSGGHIPRWWLTLISGAFVTLFLLRNGVSIGFGSSSLLPAWAFVKVPLSPAELLWYLVATGLVITWSAWAWGRAAWVAWSLRWVSLIGRQTLLLYVSHLFVQLALIEALTLLDPAPLVRATMLPLMALILVGVGAAGEALTRRSTVRTTVSPVAVVLRRLPTTAIVGSAVVVGSFVAVVTLQALIGTPATWNPAPSVDAGYEAASTAEVTTDATSSGKGDPDSEQGSLPMESGGDGYPGSLLPSEDAEHPENVAAT